MWNYAANHNRSDGYGPVLLGDLVGAKSDQGWQGVLLSE
jgi:hypothetical protein